MTAPPLPPGNPSAGKQVRDRLHNEALLSNFDAKPRGNMEVAPFLLPKEEVGEAQRAAVHGSADDTQYVCICMYVCTRHVSYRLLARYACLFAC